MAKAIFTTKIEPAYDDLPEARYHFPSSYLGRVEQTVGDWIVYYEPRRKGEDRENREGRKSYFATAKVTNIYPDPSKPDYYYAEIDTQSYMEFNSAVPFKDGEHYFEAALRKDDGSTNRGAFGHSVRLIPESEYDAILKKAFSDVLRDFDSKILPIYETNNDAEDDYQSRRVIEYIAKKPFRAASFKRNVRKSYKNICAMTGIALVDHVGLPEIHAAHIMPVEKNGPDSVRNGIALTATIHWMFDRGLVSIDEDFSILVAENKVPKEILQLLNSSGKILLPDKQSLYPHSKYLRFHRLNIFKG